MRTKRAFTLIEILAALAVLGILMLAFVRFFGGTLKTSGRLQVQNELLNEGQISQQLIASRIKEAWYLFPKGTTIRLTNSGWTTKNVFDNSYNWTVGERFIAMILPPKLDNVKCSEDSRGCFRFYAYYPLPRSWYQANASAVVKLNPDPENDPHVWVMMEYRANYRTCPVEDGEPDPDNTNYRGKRGVLLLDYVQPENDPWDATYNYTLFDLPTGSAPKRASTAIRMLRKDGNRVYRVPKDPLPMSLEVEAQNAGLKLPANASERPYCQ